MDFGISQLEITQFAQLDERLADLRQAMIALKDNRGLDFALLMATDVVQGSSRLLFTEDIPLLEVLPYPRLPDGTRQADGVVSRKKQLLPAVLSALEE